MELDHIHEYRDKSPEILAVAREISYVNPCGNDLASFGKTGDALVNLMFDAMGRLYFKTNQLKGGEVVRQSNVITHISADFPPSYITDGNTGTFTDQAKDLANQLGEKGIPHEITLFNKSEAKLKHGYEGDLSNPYAKENFKRMIDFINQNVTK
ncbi:hypothetical protein [Paenibacillus xylanexedens]|uniref:hypothetical protein n=1 Tax=Paenibacillus xylanexedens TaxID=528191 RepID=UPI0011A95BB9|nr:hypothetical protein [Paenibacillus xylanexedens]